MEEDTLYDKVTLPYTDMAPKGGETPFFLVLLLLIFFPPAAWYVMWKEEEYHRWFAYLIALYGVVTLLGSLIIQQILIPQSNQIYAQLNLQQPAVSPFTYVTTYFIFGFAEIIIALILFLANYKKKIFPKVWLIVGVLVLAYASLIQPITLTYLTYTAYNSILIQSRQQNTLFMTPIPTQIPTVTTTLEKDDDPTASPASK